MPGRVESSEPFLQREMHIGDRSDHYLAPLDRYTNPLIDAQVGLASYSGGQSDPQAVAPLPDIKDCFGHDQLPN